MDKKLEKSKKFVDEFKEFITKGNVMDMAVGVIIGGAFQNIINSLVNDVIMPLISAITGGIDFSNWFVALDGKEYATLAAAQESGAATLNYGTFITVVINFLLMALVIFCLVKTLEKVRTSVKKTEEVEEAQDPTEKECPYCKSMIAIDATRCPHCTSQLD
ncbi:MAG: large conductance mechanosensitive channel protein MscL [Lachnospiraceae bacterium]|nr:large conductance mechanosensitive channel protein MscL [Lachnospiraceae bacterium]